MPLTVEVGSDGRPRPNESVGPTPALSVQPDVPSTVCTTAQASRCFTVRVIATGVGPVRRLLPLPDGRLVVLRENGTVTVLPSGVSERPPLGRDNPGIPSAVVDVAVDPEFRTNRFLYFATVGGTPGKREVSIIRARELADRIGEAAAIVTGLPTASIGEPVISLGSDRHVYLAMPLDPAVERQFYDGHVLRFTRDGAAAGHARSGSPILAQGSIRPMSFAWAGGAGLLMASSRPAGAPPLAVVSFDTRPGAWPAAPVPVGGTDMEVFRAGIRDVVFRSGPAPGSPGQLAVLSVSPEALYIATLTPGDSPVLASVESLPFWSLTPTSAAFADNGDLVVAARPGNDAAQTRLLLLRAR